MKNIFFPLFLGILTSSVFAMKENTIKFLDEKQYDDFRNSINIETADLTAYHSSGLNPYISPQDYLTLCPFPKHSRGFMRRSIEDYVQTMNKNEKPTRLIIACGHEGKYAEKECPHNEDYFTVDISRESKPDVIGDIFSMMPYIFQANTWDFIRFEGLEVYGDTFNQSAEFIKKSLKPQGVWFIEQGEVWFPSTMQIGDFQVKIGIPQELIDQRPEIKGSIMRTICKENLQITENGEFVSFDGTEKLQETVSKFFQNLGFEGAELRMNFPNDFDIFHKNNEIALEEKEKIGKVFNINFYDNKNVLGTKEAFYLHKGIEKLAGEELIHTKNERSLAVSVIIAKK